MGERKEEKVFDEGMLEMGKLIEWGWGWGGGEGGGGGVGNGGEGGEVGGGRG